MYKIGFIGNSCTGKTTSCFNLIKELKFKRLRTGYCNDICRFFSFEPELFDRDPYARLHILHKQISIEMENMVRKDVDYLITERTSLDWICYFQASFEREEHKFYEDHLNVGFDWASSYDLLFFMHPMGEYFDDGNRPGATHIRDKVQPEYDKMRNYLQNYHNGEVIDIYAENVKARTREVEIAFKEWLKNDHEICNRGEVWKEVT